MKTLIRPDLAEALVESALAADRAGFRSGGNAVSSVKELTLCLLAAWYKKQAKQRGEAVTEEFDAMSNLKIAMGTAWGRFLNPEPEVRVEIPTPHGIVSGRVDLWEKDGDELIPCELKVTWAKESPTPADQHVEQLISYVIGQQLMEHKKLVRDGHARLYTAFIGGWKPVVYCYDLFLTISELRVFYEEIVRRTGAVTGTAKPSAVDRPEWSCRYCSFFIKNGGICDPQIPGRKAGFFVDDKYAD